MSSRRSFANNNYTMLTKRSTQCAESESVVFDDKYSSSWHAFSMSHLSAK
jgi:hypothetical protein